MNRNPQYSRLLADVHQFLYIIARDEALGDDLIPRQSGPGPAVPPTVQDLHRFALTEAKVPHLNHTVVIQCHELLGRQ